jgi:recombination protein RecT
MAIDIRTRTQEVVALIEHPSFLQQIEDSLPEGVSLQRFVSVAKTAIRTNSELATADQTSLFGSIVRCAQDGLLPDGREAALVLYKGKVAYLPMIGGIRRIAAVYGWQIRTNVVYENDEFDYTEEPPAITHRSVRPGMERGDLVAAYAVATHRDGRRVQTVLHPEDIAKRRAKAQTTRVWDEFTPQMWEKSAGHDVFGQLSLDPADARVSTILREGILDPIAALYGRQPESSRAGEPATDDRPYDGEPPAGSEAAAAEEPLASAAAAEDEEAVWTPVPTQEEVDAAAAMVVPRGVHKDRTLAQVAELEDGPTWLLTQLKKMPAGEPRVAMETFVQARLPETWARFEAWKAQS